MSAQDLRRLADTDVRDDIPPEKLHAALLSPPFVYIPGTFNTRDLGLVPSVSGSPRLRSGFAFRSGALSGLKDDGKVLLAGQLGVRRVFDLRSQTEHAQQPDPDVDGVRNEWIPPKEVSALVNLPEFVDGDGETGYANMYLDVMDFYEDSFRAVLEHVRDRPTEPFLFHCAAGRDRTGVLAGMLMTLAGAERDAIALDFLLSRLGTEPAREQLVAFARKGSGAESNDTPGFYNLCSLKENCWDAFIGAVQEKYGGFDGYVVKTLGLSEDDLVRIKHNLAKTP